MRIISFGAIIAIALAAQPVPARDKAPPLPHWMAGAWVQAEGESWTEEYWTPPRGGLMIGAGRHGIGDTLSGWEATRIERGKDGNLSFIATPGGASPTNFAMVGSTPDSIVFANPAHDYPQRIRYWREGAHLLAEISLADGSKAIRWRYQPAAR